MTPSPIKIALAEDNEYFCSTLEHVLSEASFISFAGHAPSIELFLNLVQETPPDIALLDLDLTHPRDGIEILKWLSCHQPKVLSIILTVNEKEIAECYKLGAKGYLLKSNLDNLIDTIKMVHGGSLIIPPGISNLLISQMREQADQTALRLELKKFSEREIELLKLFHQKHSRSEIAHQLCLSQFTIKRHVENILKKDHEASIKAVTQRYGPLL